MCLTLGAKERDSHGKINHSYPFSTFIFDVNNEE